MTEVTASIPALPSTSRPCLPRTNAATQWLPPVGLIVLSLIPVLAGAVRVIELMGSPQITANNARFVDSPIPVTVHILSVTVFSLLGALQFVPSLRRGKSSWHRIAGRILIPAGVLVALSGLWMTVFYARPVGDGESLDVVRLILGSAMLVSIVLAVVAIRRGDFPNHGAWMTRGYAIALGAGTQVFTMLPWVVIFGPTPHSAHDGGLGDQSRGGRVRHSPAAHPPIQSHVCWFASVPNGGGACGMKDDWPRAAQRHLASRLLWLMLSLDRGGRPVHRRADPRALDQSGDRMVGLTRSALTFHRRRAASQS